MRKLFNLKSKYSLTDAQRSAVQRLVELLEVEREATLLGVTGSGKTFVMANVIQELGLPTLLISPNKVLAAQLFSELREFFPENAVEFFISYYDFYRPEAYIPESDLYIRKEVEINEVIDALRHRATSAVLSRSDVIVVSSVSCIYNIGHPEEYWNSFLRLSVGQTCKLEELLEKLVELQYENGNWDFRPGTFRYRGNALSIFPPQGQEVYILEFDDELLERITVRGREGQRIGTLTEVYIPPARHFQVSQNLDSAIRSIEEELKERVSELRRQGKLVEAKRLESRTRYDILALKTRGYCHGIENYWRHLAGLKPGTPPYTLLDYFVYAYDKDFLVIVDESHITIPQLRAMYLGDRRRKEVLIEHGFRLPSCLDNRPLKFEEFLERVPRLLTVSATPGDWELQRGKVVELLVRPTGIVDPEVEVRCKDGSFEYILGLINRETGKGNRVLITTLTQRTAEDVAELLKLRGVMSAYLHAKIDPLDRISILKSFREGRYKVLVGVNLLREGLDLPEVSTVVILDADIQGFLRSKRSIIQIAGRAARHVASKVVLIADEITPAMEEAIREMRRRREYQLKYNAEHGIIPRSVSSRLRDPLEAIGIKLTTDTTLEWVESLSSDSFREMNVSELKLLKQELTQIMHSYSKELEYEKAAIVRDKLSELNQVYKEKLG